MPGLTIRTDQLSPSEALFLQRQLEAIQPQLLEHKRPPRNFARIFPVGKALPSGAKTYTQHMIRALGRAVIASGATTVIPRVALAVDEVSRNIRYLVNGYGWTVFEVKQAAFARLPLESRLGLAARDVIEDGHNRIWWNGDATAGLWGLFTHPGIPRVTLAEPISGAATSKLALLAALKDFLRQVFFNTNTVAEAVNLVLAPNAYAYLADNYRSDESDLTLLQALKNSATQAGIPLNVSAARELEGAGPGGEDLLVAFAAGDSVLRGECPGGEVFMQLPPQFQGFNVDVPCYGANGGVVSDYPLEACIGIEP